LFAAMALVLIASVAAVYIMGMLTLHRTQELVRRQGVLDHLEQMLSTLKDAETGQRGYLLTGNDAYLAPYHDAISHIHNELNLLTKRAAAGELDADEVQRLSDLTKAKFDELETTLSTRRKEGFDAAMKIVEAGRGRQLMEEIRTLSGYMQDRERAGVLEARRVADRYTYFRTTTFVFITLLNLAFLAWAFGRITAEMDAQRQATLEARRQKDLVSVTLASIGDAVIVTDNKANVTFMNQVAVALTGWQSAEAEGKPLAQVFRIVNEYTRQPVENPVEKVLRLGAIVGLANHTVLIRRDGTETPIDDSGAPIRAEDGTVHGVVLIFRDFTSYKEGERKLQQAKVDAESASRAKDQFLAALSHELRTPLTPVLATLTNWEATDAVPESLHDQVVMLRRNVELEARLIDDLLDLTRIAKGRIQLNTETVDIHDLLWSVQGICRSDMNAKRIEAEVHLEATQHFVHADSARMQQVFWNILRNAAKFTAEHGKIEIRTSDDPNGRVRVTIIDNGIGMSPETLARVFHPFDQGDDDIISKRYGGLGLGLAITKALLDVQGGTIDAQSEGVGKGARFSVTLPTIPAPQPSQTDPASAPRLRMTPLRILLVEDHIDTARAMSRLLRGLGHEVHTAGTMSSAMQSIEADHFNLLISDIGLPDGTGLELIRLVRQRSDVPAIALTGFGMEDDIAKCQEAGFNLHLTKPVNFQKLELVVHQFATPSS
jgi:PAS domain S-box-containing protein